MARKLTQYDRRRLALRDRLWPDAASFIYYRKDEAGFITIPRTLPMIGTLIKYLSDKHDPSRVYFELWARQRDDGLVVIDDPDELATAAGFYRGETRRRRSLREALDRLVELGFLRIAGKGVRKHAFVLILHPHDVIQRIHHADRRRIPDWWWSLFEFRTQDIGAKLRLKPPKRGKKPVEGDDPFDDFPEALLGEDDDLPF